MTSRPPQPASLYICNWSLNEPLCQSQTLPYLRALAARGYGSCLVTFERAPYALPRLADGDVKRRLAGDGICWHPVPYHTRTSLISALYDGLGALKTATLAVVRHRPRLVHTRTSVPGAIGLPLARLFRRPFLYDADSELSAEYADAGYWRRGSLAYRLLAGTERLCRDNADAVVVLSERLRSDFVARGVRAPVTVIPCCVELHRFRFDEGERRKQRQELGVDREKLLVYVGKTGPRYLVDEMMAFTNAIASRGGVRLLVLTHGDARVFQAIATRCGLNPSWVIVRRAAPDDVPRWLCAADAGLALIRESGSERGSSPIKVSEYLASGLPVVIGRGIGDLSAAIEKHALGVVVAQGSRSAYASAVDRLYDLWRQPETIRQRCAGWAQSVLDVECVAVPRYARVYEMLLAGRDELLGAGAVRTPGDAAATDR